MSKKAPKRAYENQCVMLTKPTTIACKLLVSFNKHPQWTFLELCFDQLPLLLSNLLPCTAPYFPQPLQAKWEACNRMTTTGLATLESVLCMSVFSIRQELPEVAANTSLIRLLKHELTSKQGSYHCESFSGRNSKLSNPIWNYFLLKGLGVTWTCIQTLDKHIPLLKYDRAIWLSLFLINVRPGALASDSIARAS